MVKLLDEGGVFSFSFISGPCACMHLCSCIVQESAKVCQLLVPVGAERFKRFEYRVVIVLLGVEYARLRALGSYTRLLAIRNVRKADSDGSSRETPGARSHCKTAAATKLRVVPVRYTYLT